MWDSEGDLQATWHPSVPGVPNICALRSEPATPALGGVAYRGPDGSTSTIPANLPPPDGLLPRDDAEAAQEAVMDLIASNIGCAGDTAYVQVGNRIASLTVEW